MTLTAGSGPFSATEQLALYDLLAAHKTLRWLHSGDRTLIALFLPAEDPECWLLCDQGHLSHHADEVETAFSRPCPVCRGVARERSRQWLALLLDLATVADWRAGYLQPSQFRQFRAVRGVGVEDAALPVEQHEAMEADQSGHLNHRPGGYGR